MASVLTCPTAEQLRQLALGELPETVAAALAEHVDLCPTCLHALGQVQLDDPLLQALSPTSTFPGVAEGMEVQRLIDNLSARPLPVPDDKTLSTVAGANGAGPNESTKTELGTPRDESKATPLPMVVPMALVGHPRYRIVAQLGSGGMGAVFKAEHLLMRRIVALKVVGQLSREKPGVLERFLQEVKAAAHLTHPNIVTAYDADQAGDLHFLVMEYVEGSSLAQLVKAGGPLPIIQACEYVRQAAEGLQYAHEKGMVHRDVKPHNLMLTTAGRVKILDFGLARFVSEGNEAEGLTEPGMAMGTPDYIAPEQAMDAHSADIRADIYSLGCTLYHLLAGLPPFTKGTPMQKIMSHVQEPPPSLSTARPEAPPELVAVLDRMLAKDPAKRFQTPAEVALALTPFLPGERAQKKTEGRKQKAGKKLLLFACILFSALCLLVAGIIYVQTNQGVLIIRTDDKDIEVTVRGAGEEWTITDTQTNQKLRFKAGTYEIIPAGGRTGYKLDQNRVTITRGGEAIVLITREKPPEQQLAAPVQTPYQLFHIRQLVGHRAQVNKGAFSPDGKWALTASSDHTLRLWNVATGRPVRPFEGSNDTIWCVAFSPDGREALSGGGSLLTEKKVLPGKDFFLQLWNVETGQQLARFPGNEKRVLSLAIAPDGRHAFSGGMDGTLRLWNLVTRTEERSMPIPKKGSADCVAFAPDGLTAVSGCWNGDVILWEMSSGRKVRQFDGHTSPVLSAAFSPDGKQLLTGCLDRTMRLWDVASGKEIRAFQHPTGVGSVAFLPNGAQAISGSGLHLTDAGYAPAGKDVCVRVWDLQSGQKLCWHEMLAGQGIHSLAVAANGRLILACGSSAGTAQLLWLSGNGIAPLPRTLSKDSRGQVIWEDGSNNLPLLVLKDNKIETVIEPHAGPVELSAGDYDLELGKDSDAWVLSTNKITVTPGCKVVVAIQRRPPAKISALILEELRALESPQSIVGSIALSSDNRLALVGCSDKKARLYDMTSGKELSADWKPNDVVRCVALSPDGKRAAFAGGDQVSGKDFDIHILDTDTAKEIQRLKGHRAPVIGVAFTPDGRQVISSGIEGSLRSWDLQSGKSVKAMPEYWMASLAVSADCKRALIGCNDGSIRLWDLEAGKRKLILMGHSASVKSVAFSLDGRQALSASLDRTVRLWDLDKGEEIRVLRHPTCVGCAVFTPDGRRALTGSGFRPEPPYRLVPAGGDSRVRLWDLKTGEELAHYEAPSNNGVAVLAVAADGKTVLVGHGTQLQILKLPTP
jgi:WD40 repeat protein